MCWSNDCISHTAQSSRERETEKKSDILTRGGKDFMLEELVIQKRERDVQ